MNENIEEYYLGINEDQLFLQWLSDLHAHSFQNPSHFGPGTGEVALNRLPYHLARALAAKGLDKPPREFFVGLAGTKATEIAGNSDRQGKRRKRGLDRRHD